MRRTVLYTYICIAPDIDPFFKKSKFKLFTYTSTRRGEKAHRKIPSSHCWKTVPCLRSSALNLKCEMKISVFVFGLLVASSSAIRGHESRFRNLEREVAFSDEEIDNAWAPKIAGRRLHAKEDTPSKAPSTAIPSTAVPSTAPW